MRKILNVKTNNYTVICTVDNDEVYEFDMSFVLMDDKEMTIPLKDQSFFDKVYLEYGSLAWPNGYDIHVNTVIRDGKKVDKVAS